MSLGWELLFPLFVLCMEMTLQLEEQQESFKIFDIKPQTSSLPSEEITILNFQLPRLFVKSIFNLLKLSKDADKQSYLL